MRNPLDELPESEVHPTTSDTERGKIMATMCGNPFCVPCTRCGYTHGHTPSCDHYDLDRR